MSLRLVTIGVSHFCEKARWALDRTGLAYVEEAHVPVFHLTAKRRWDTNRTLPALVTPDGTIKDSTDILRYCDHHLPEAQRLFPADAGLAGEVADLEDELDERLGPATRVWAYSWAIADTGSMARIVTAGVSGFERAFIRGAGPLVAMAMRRGMRLGPQAIETAEQRIAEVFEALSPRLARGRYLAGDRFTAADLAFAALASPLVYPEEYGVALPPLEEVSPGMRARVLDYRGTAAGAHALRMFREHRRE